MKVTPKLRNDVILTISLVLSMVVIRVIMLITGLKFHDTTSGNITFLVLFFIIIKSLYNGITKLANYLDRRKLTKKSK
jgi:hypothetical protein